MKKRALGNTGIQLSEIGFGCALHYGVRMFLVNKGLQKKKHMKFLIQLFVKA